MYLKKGVYLFNMWYLVIILVLMIICVRYNNVDYDRVNGYDIWIYYRYRVMILVMLDMNVYQRYSRYEYGKLV